MRCLPISRFCSNPTHSRKSSLTNNDEANFMSYHILYTLVSFATCRQYLLSAHCLPDTLLDVVVGGEGLGSCPCVAQSLIREVETNPTAIQMNVQPPTEKGHD